MKDKKWALITGASSGIGAQFAKLYAQHNFHLIITARSEDKLTFLKNEIQADHSGIEVEIIVCDLSAKDGANNLYKETKARNLFVDTLINNAGFGIYGDFCDSELSKVEDMLQLNITTLTQLTHLYLQDMKEHKKGEILLVASIGAYQPAPNYAVYCATKSYVLNFGEAISYEMKPYGVTVSVLSPGATATEFFNNAGQKTNAIQDFLTMKAALVAKVGMSALESKKQSVIPGVLNKFTAFLVRFMPRKLQVIVAAQAMKE